MQSVDEAPQFHRDICGDIDAVSNVNRNDKIAEAAPRGHGKSSYLSKATPLREICFRKRKYIIIISETPSVSGPNLEWIANQLKYNKKLREDFGPLLSPKSQGNIKDNSEEFVAWEPDGEGVRELTMVQASSTGKALRGRSWNGSRPDLIICDDLEDARPGGNAATKEQREHLRSWFNSTVIPLGDPKGEKTAFIVIGTIVHEESLLNNLIKHNADFKSKKYRAIIQEPSRRDLWDECRALYLDGEKTAEERKANAEQYYAEHKEEMDEGAVVLWEEAQPIWRLMVWKWSFGSKAFNTEYQNEPRDEESQIFVPANFHYFDESDIFDAYGRQLALDVYAFWDIAAGKSKRADYNAIVTVGRERKTGVIYILDTWARKCPTHEALNMAVEKIREFGHHAFLVETIGIGTDFYRQLKERLAKERIYGTRIKPISHHSTKKELRIEALEPICENGFLRFKRNQGLLLEQLEQFPSGQHDDVADALSGAVAEIGTGRRKKSYRKKPAGL